MFEFFKSKPAARVERIEPKISNSMEFVDVPSSDAVRMGQIFGSIPTDSGAVVNEKTAMRVSAVYACVRLLAGAIATTPWTFYRKGADDSRERANDHPCFELLNQEACPAFTAATFWEFVAAQVLLRGDGHAYILRKGRYSPEVEALLPVRREHIEPFRVGRRIAYRITDTDDQGNVKYFVADQDDVLHFPGLGFNGLVSQSVIGWAARQAIGIAIQADSHAANTFGSGASVQYAVKAPKSMTQVQQEDFRMAWAAKYGVGSRVGASNIPLILTEGVDITQLSMTAVDAQLLDSRKFQVVDIARAFGVPPHMIGETSASTSWGTGIEQMSLGFLKWSMRPHLVRWRQELNRKLPLGDAYFVEPNVDGHLEGDSKAQGEYFGKALGGPGAQGWMTVNEVRRLKNLPPIEGGDEIYKPKATPTAAPGDKNPGKAGDDGKEEDDETGTQEPAPATAGA